MTMVPNISSLFCPPACFSYFDIIVLLPLQKVRQLKTLTSMINENRQYNFSSALIRTVT